MPRVGRTPGLYPRPVLADLTVMRLSDHVRVLGLFNPIRYRNQRWRRALDEVLPPGSIDHRPKYQTATTMGPLNVTFSTSKRIANRKVSPHPRPAVRAKQRSTGVRPVKFNQAMSPIMSCTNCLVTGLRDHRERATGPAGAAYNLTLLKC